MELPNLDALAGTDSVSKGVFTFMGKRSPDVQGKGRKRKRGSGGSAERKPKLPFLRGSSGRRHAMFKDMWGEATRVMDLLQKDNYSQIVDQILCFVEESSSATAGGSQVPTACLLTGINVPDHEDFFKRLKSSLLRGSTPHVASVLSKTSAATVRSLFKLVVQQLASRQEGRCSEDQGDDGDEEEEEAGGGEAKLQRKTSPRALRTWYNNQYEKSSKRRPRLVVVLEDFEMFSPKVLQDFVHTLRLLELPIVLIFGVATTVESIHRSLPHSVTSYLAIRKFSSEPSINLLSKIMVKLAIRNPKIPLKLGPGTLKILLETFMFHDFSVKHFFTAYKHCLMEHFMENEHSALCCRSAAELKSRVADLTADEMDAFKALPSFQRWKGDDEEPEDFRMFVVDRLNVLSVATQNFNLFVECLWQLVMDVPRQSLGKYYHSVYNLALTEPIQSTQEYREAFQFLALCERTSMEAKLKSFLSCIRDCRSVEVVKVAKAAEGLLDELSEVDSLKHPDKLEASSDFSTPKGKLTRFQLQEVLLERAKEKRKLQEGPFEAWRKKVLDFYHSAFKTHLSSPMDLLFNEVIYYESPTSVRLRLQGNPRVAIQKALSAPHVYLDNEEVKLDTLDAISPALPDVCIAYKLHLECGRYINLVDWYQCWLSILDHGEEADGTDKVLHARFSRAVAELQFLGFVRPSRRKTDHVERLTWSS